MNKMVRKQVYIEAQQEALLKHLSKQQGVTEAELIRAGIARLSPASGMAKDRSFWEQEKKFIHALMKRRAVPSKRKWKREDLYER
jgi:hypothetical protein